LGRKRAENRDQDDCEKGNGYVRKYWAVFEFPGHEAEYEDDKDRSCEEKLGEKTTQ